MDYFSHYRYRLDTHSHPATTLSNQPTQVPAFLSANPSAQASICTTEYHPSARPVLGNSRTQEYRVPLLTPRSEHVSDFQPGASHVLLSLPQRPMQGNLANSLVYAPETEVYTNSDMATMSTSLPISVRLPLSFPTSTSLSRLTPQSWPLETPILKTLPASVYPGQQQPAAAPILLLEDICHLEPVGDQDTCPSASYSAATLVPPSYSAPLLVTDKPYSDCPAFEFSTPLWSSLPSSPSLGRDDFSASSSGLMLSPKKEHCDDFLRLPMDEDEPGVTPFLGIYADVNMRERAVQRQPPSFCVNPADVMANPSDEFSPSTRISLSPGLRSSVSVRSNISSTAAGISSSRAETFINRQLSHTPDFTADFPDESLVSNAFSEEAFSAIVSVLQSCVKQEEPTTALTEGIPPSGENIKPLEPVAPRPVYPHHFSAYSSNNLGAHHPSVVCESTEACTPFPGLRMPLADLPLHHFQQLQNTSYDALAPLGIPRANASVAVPPMSPVLNAHAGIELDDLRQRAADYRARHPNSELDRAFLQCFAGRLSARGELLEEYRCYVVGCGQRNKRRDHILVHVGSHVEHRPWACQHCGMRFLRKNECKRHESSHEGRKPFSCSICAPTQERNFVRQDLLRRHMRVTHGFQEARTSASKKRLEAKNAKDENAEYWP